MKPQKLLPKFNFHELSYDLYRRFLELLSRKTNAYFKLLSKTTYINSVVIRKVDVELTIGLDYISIYRDVIEIDVSDEFMYQETFENLSKFVPFFNVRWLLEYKPDDVKSYLIPKSVQYLMIFNVVNTDQIDMFYKKFYHKGTKYFRVSILSCDMEKRFHLINYSIQKMPVKEFLFNFIADDCVVEKEFFERIQIPDYVEVITIEYCDNLGDQRSKWQRFNKDDPTKHGSD